MLLHTAILCRVPRHPSPFQLLPYGIARCQLSLSIKDFLLKLMHSDYLVCWIPNFSPCGGFQTFSHSNFSRFLRLFKVWFDFQPLFNVADHNYGDHSDDDDNDDNDAADDDDNDDNDDDDDDKGC